MNRGSREVTKVVQVSLTGSSRVRLESKSVWKLSNCRGGSIVELLHCEKYF